jgi:hypothetical protein
MDTHKDRMEILQAWVYVSYFPERKVEGKQSTKEELNVWQDVVEMISK